MQELNIPLLRKTMEYIEANPLEWDQSSWASNTPCGTTMCFAGTAAFLAGADLMLDLPGVSGSEACKTPEGDFLAIDEYARQQLGLTASQADRIFYSDPHNPQDMRRVVEHTIGEKL